MKQDVSGVAFALHSVKRERIMVAVTFHPRILQHVVVLLLVAGGAAQAQDAPTERFQLPADPAAWVNSGPISLKSLEGKAAVLWFYEESCPRCREKWPELLATARMFEGKPVLFIAVNSGTSRQQVEQYARSVKQNWPTIVDSSRELEKAADVGEISLQNIYQACIITPDGRLTRGNAGKLEETAERALAGAKWNVDPAEIPAALKSAWMSVEFGNPAPVAATIKKALASPKPELKTAAEKLNAAVQAKVTSLVDQAQQAESAGNKWQAYKSYQSAVDQYGGYELPDTVRSGLKTLAEDEAVRRELQAMKSLETAKKLSRNPSASTRRSAVQRLKKLVEDFSGTEAAAEAQQALTNLGEM